MPPTRRSTTKATANSNQRTLSFTNTTKISKTSHPQNADTKKALAASSSSISLSPPNKPLGHTPTTATTTSASPKPEAEPQQQQQQQQTPEEILAAKITDAKIGKYWKEREQLRLAPRVHQKELSVAERVLREWDCMTQFGVCVFLVSFFYFSVPIFFF
ncbi:hypothetical protein ACMFMG_005976 [Clarireedia jacksonii]